MKKNILLVLLIVITILAMSISTFAGSSNIDAKSVDNPNAQLVSAYKIDSKGKHVKLSNKNIKKTNQKELDQKEVKQQNAPYATYLLILPHYSYEYTYEEYGKIRDCTLSSKTVRVTDYVYNNTQDNVTRSLRAICSTTWTANISLSGGKKDAFTATVGGSFSSTSSFEDWVQMTVRPGYKAWAEFTPLLTNSYGNMVTKQTSPSQEVSWNNEWVDAYYPQKVTMNGQTITDGNYYIYTAPI